MDCVQKSARVCVCERHELHYIPIHAIFIIQLFQCKPYHVGNKAFIIGDAAHAMVPFYAQGMNSVRR